MRLNHDLRRLEHEGVTVMLSRNEYALVERLVRREAVVPHGELMDALDPNLESSGNIYTIVTPVVKRVRKKLREAYGHDHWLKTMHGEGYYWDRSDETVMEPRSYIYRGKHRLNKRPRRDIPIPRQLEFDFGD